ncbi:MAG: hypothetical protein JW708_12275 [Vallitaleaceae bacterium]|nr:hypothetical protein [Vallitaleaceae bacterium]
MNWKSLFQNRNQKSLVLFIICFLLLPLIFVIIYTKISEQGATDDKKHVYEIQLLELAQRVDEGRIELEKTDTLQEFRLIQEKLYNEWIKKSEALKKSLAAEELDTILYRTLFSALEEYRRLLEMGKELELRMEQAEKEVYLFISQGGITSIDYNQDLEAFFNEYYYETNLENMEAALLNLRPISENDQKVHQLFEDIFSKILEYENNKLAIHSELRKNGLELEGFEAGCRSYVINIFSENIDENDIDD